MPHAGVYQIVNSVNGRVYVGSAINWRDRWSDHRKELRAGRHTNAYLQRSWLRHGEGAFECHLIESCDQTQTLKREQRWLDALFATRPRHGLYNIARSASAPMLGLKQSMLTSMRRSIALRGKRRTPETRARMSAAQAINKGTPEMRAVMSMRWKGKPKSEETRAKISASKSGKPGWGKGIPKSAETIAKMRATKRARFEERRRAKCST